MADRYDPSSFEAKWRDKWAEAELFLTREREGAAKFYGMDFFPYPSGAGLSVGHCRNYVPTDVLCRMKVMQGYNVLHPMGFDAFGLPAENEAIDKKTHPAPMIERYAARYKEQMDLIGVSYDWSRSFSSSDPGYYRWTQWIFEQLYKKGLAYQKDAAVNWDPVDKTVLADEEVVGGRAERSGALVEKKFIPQWFFKITAYADRLIDDLDDLDWPEGIKNQQRNWIGRSVGVEFEMTVAGSGAGASPAAYDLASDDPGDKPAPAQSFRVFTTRIDTVFGMTFCVLSPEHPLVAQFDVSEEDRARIAAYQEQARTLSDIDRTSNDREKTGVFTGAYAINPANGAKVPIWIADYVLATYGTGAIMAVPAHDDRDFAFADKFGIEVIQVIAPSGGGEVELPYIAKDGVLINSAEYDGLTVAEAQASLGLWVEALGIGERKTQFKLRDWLISRQRYWGCPIPIIHSKDGEQQLVPESQLPVELPMVDHYEPSGDGTSPLAHIPGFVNVTDLDGRLGKRETDTMGGFACSSWYFLRFADPHNEEAAWSRKAADYWMPVDCYVGGAEHAVMHLLYARFWTKVLYDADLVGVKEPFARLQNQGQVLAFTPFRQPREGETLGVGEDGILVSFADAKEMDQADLKWQWRRMSKSKGNVVTPDEMVETAGADALRLYLLFKAPFNADIEWENKGVEDLGRFLSRVFRLVNDLSTDYGIYDKDWRDQIPFAEVTESSKRIRRATHQTIRNVTDDIDRFGFNTYVSWLMKFVNELTVWKAYAAQASGKDRVVTGSAPPPADINESATRLALSEAIETLVLLIAPGAPHSADELWSELGHEGFTYDAKWPVSDAALATDDEATIALQVNGKLRDTFTLPTGASKEEHETAALARPKLVPYLEGVTVRKVIVVPGKLVNVVVG